MYGFTTAQPSIFIPSSPSFVYFLRVRGIGIMSTLFARAIDLFTRVVHAAPPLYGQYRSQTAIRYFLAFRIEFKKYSDLSSTY